MTTANASQESPKAAQFVAFRQAWIDGVVMTSASMFACQSPSPVQASHWRQLTPKVDIIRKRLPNKSQVDAAFVSAMVSFYNAEEGQKLLKKAGCESFGLIATILTPPQRHIIVALFLNYRGW